jgi:hypothetical protein
VVLKAETNHVYVFKHVLEFVFDLGHLTVGRRVLLTQLLKGLQVVWAYILADSYIEDLAEKVALVFLESKKVRLLLFAQKLHGLRCPLLF